jgi:hypothetical protein
MDEILIKFDMKYHPLQDLDFQYVKELNFVNRSTIRLLSYNVFLRPPPVKNNEDDYKNERLADIIHRLDEYDIVCLQEMFGSFSLRKQTLIKFAKQLGFFFIVEPPSPSFYSSYLIDAGLLILSRY